MNEKARSYHVEDFSAERRVISTINGLYWQKHCMYGLLEVDVTVSRRFIQDYKARTGELLSFTGYLVFCLARAVEENSEVQAYLKGRKQLVVFDDVDIGLMVERKMGENHTLMGYVIRGANHKTYGEIHQEIRSVQSTPAPRGRGMPRWFQSAILLPWPLSRLFTALLSMATSRDPTIFTSMAGTVGISSVGMFSKDQSGWGLVPSEHALDLIVGSIAWKPAVVEGRIEPREILNLTVVFDHDLINGGPATRFTRRLVELIESGYGLEEKQTPTAVDTEAVAARTRVPA
ncbi:MAG: 2-oxo acid dehydrogenase subunit E2 [Anaerolineae bacterium]